MGDLTGVWIDIDAEDALLEEPTQLAWFGMPRAGFGGKGGFHEASEGLSEKNSGPARGISEAHTREQRMVFLHRRQSEINGFLAVFSGQPGYRGDQR